MEGKNRLQLGKAVLPILIVLRIGVSLVIVLIVVVLVVVAGILTLLITRGRNGDQGKDCQKTDDKKNYDGA